MHEVMHGLGPHDIAVGGRQTTVRQALKETYSAIEEAKADISGLWSLHYLVDKGVAAGRDRRLAVRHVPGVRVPVDPLRDHRGARPRHRDSAELPARQGSRGRRADGTFAIAPGKVRGAVESLTREIMTLQAAGDYAAATRMIETLGVVRPEVQRVLDRLAGVPVDIAPRFTSAVF